MTFLEAAYSVLRDAGKPLHFREIARRAFERGRIKQRAKPPQPHSTPRLPSTSNMQIIQERLPGLYALGKESWL